MTASTLAPMPPASSGLSVLAAGLRFIAATGVAVVVTVGLFYLMRALIWVEDPVVEEVDPLPIIEISVVAPDEPIEPIEPPTQADHVEAPPPVTLDPDPSDAPINPIDVGPPPQVDIDPDTGNMGQITRLPPPVSVRVPPVYPPRLAQRGIEGGCTIQYDILGSGRTANARAIDCDHAGFESASLAAVAQWRHAVVQGAGQEAVIQRGVQTRLDFQLEG